MMLIFSILVPKVTWLNNQFGITCAPVFFPACYMAATCFRKGFELVRKSLRQRESLKKMKENGMFLVFYLWQSHISLSPFFLKQEIDSSFSHLRKFPRYLALRKAEKEEEKRAREKVLQKLEADKVFTISIFLPLNIEVLLPNTEMGKTKEKKWSIKNCSYTTSKSRKRSTWQDFCYLENKWTIDG